MNKRILALDLGTNSIGWALIENNSELKEGSILAAGSRILPMSQDMLGKFDSGQSISQTAERTGYRGIRRLRERHLLRRERLHRVLNILGFLPEHYAAQIDFKKHVGQFFPEIEPKLPYVLNTETLQRDFIFKSSFLEMLNDFSIHQPELLKDGKMIPYDWTIYYLRKKALSKKIGKEELAWVLLNFNQKRGYYQLRGEEDEDATKTSETRTYFINEKIESIIDTGQVYKGLKVFKVSLNNGESGKYYNRTTPLWLGETRNIIVTVTTDKEGNDRLEDDGSIKKKFSIPTNEDWDKKWKLVKIKTEKEIEDSNKTVGEYIYDTLLQKPDQKIKGKLVRVVERKFYKSELETILKKQKEYHPELSDGNFYQACIEELYRNNDSHRSNISQKDFVHLFLNDIIFYQRPLKSKKSLISNCKFESRSYIKDGKKETEPLKCIPKSHPLFQEFRLWQFVQNLKIYQNEKIINGKTETDVNVTEEFLKTEDDVVNLFEWLNERKEVDQKALLKYPAFNLKKNTDQYRWNYVNDKTYPCNETRTQLVSRLKKIEDVPHDFLNRENEEALWHILYSVSDAIEIEKALKTFAKKQGLQDVPKFVDEFKKFPPYTSEYGSYSAKALKKMLPLMRTGKYWSEENIDPGSKDRIYKIIDGEYDNKIQDRVREKTKSLNAVIDFQGLPVWLVSYIVYNIHSEDGEALKWKTSLDIENYLRFAFKQHSLRNPTVEKVIGETLRVVADIWKIYGRDEENFFDEIHIELGREMKNPAEKRKKMTEQLNENENTNLRIKSLLTELINDKEYENIRPYSPMQQEILKIYEEGVLSAENDIPDDILKITKMSQPSASELIRYKLWLQQRYRSPYTGIVIPLNKLFTRAYEIEHVVPQSRYFDDSFSNKVICETEVNKDKDNLTAYEYIKKNEGKTVELSFGKEVRLFTLEEYEYFIKNNYGKSRVKMKKLLMEDIPEAFIERQLNDTRYISKVVKSLLSNIVRQEGEQEAISKNVIASSGSITSTLKKDWGLNDVWNDLITPRFERLNELTKSSNFGAWTNKEGKRFFQTQVPLQFLKGFNKKRIDHRHHALDAIVIACATRNHINYLNNTSALGKEKKEDKEKKRHDLKHLLCVKKTNNESKGNYKWIFNKPWETFSQDVKETLSTIVVSFKQNLRVINKTTNYSQVWRQDESGQQIKVLEKQSKGQNWSIRKPMHKDTVSGLVQLKLKKTVSLSVALDTWKMVVDKELQRKVKGLVKQGYDKQMLIKFFKEQGFRWNEKDIAKVEIYYWDRDNVASRVAIDESFNSSRINTSITDTGIQKIMLNHLNKYNEDKNGKLVEHPEIAFSPDGLDIMNKCIAELNGGKVHPPIYKVRTYEPKGNKFNVGQTGNKADKYVEAAKGTNLFFAVYVDESGKRNYETIPLNEVIERQKQTAALRQKLSPVPEINAKGDKLLFYLSPNDLVYLPSEEETEMNGSISTNLPRKNQVERIYKMVSSSGNQCFFIKQEIASPIVNKVEFGPNNKMEKSIEGLMIKEVCIKLQTDRLGNIKMLSFPILEAIT